MAMSSTQDLGRSIDRLYETGAAIKAERDELLSIVRDLLSAYDAEGGVIFADPDAGCPECTVGTVPNNLNTGLCALHRGFAAIRLSEASHP